MKAYDVAIALDGKARIATACTTRNAATSPVLLFTMLRNRCTTITT
jgi:hypothetical protein